MRKQKEILNGLRKLGWSSDKTGLWHRPPPHDKEAGLYWRTAALEAGILTSEVEEVELD